MVKRLGDDVFAGQELSTNAAYTDRSMKRYSYAIFGHFVPHVYMLKRADFSRSLVSPVESCFLI